MTCCTAASSCWAHGGLPKTDSYLLMSKLYQSYHDNMGLVGHGRLHGESNTPLTQCIEYCCITYCNKYQKNIPARSSRAKVCPLFLRLYYYLPFQVYHSLSLHLRTSNMITIIILHQGSQLKFTLQLSKVASPHMGEGSRMLSPD